MTIIGNERSQRETEEAIRAVPRFLILAGPENLGKGAFVRSFLDSFLDESDVLHAESGPDGARQARPFLSDMPSFSPMRAVFVDDMDFLSEPAQDSWLKLCEEPSGPSCIVATAADPMALLPPLLSRVVRTVRWLPLPEEAMLRFTVSLQRDMDQFAFRASGGRPGLYSELCSPGYVALHESVLCAISDPSPELLVPSVVKDLDPGRSVARSSVVSVVRRAALSVVADAGRRNAAIFFLRFAADILRVPSANAELHWRNAVISSLRM